MEPDGVKPSELGVLQDAETRPGAVGLKDRPPAAVAPRVAIDDIPGLARAETASGPVWRQLADLIRQRVESGAWRHGDRLPTEIELAVHFGVNRHTLRKAVGTLVEDRLLTTVRGRGTFVAGAPPLAFQPPWQTSEQHGFGDEPITERFLHHQIVEATGRLGPFLAVDAHAALHRLDLKLEAGTVPVALARYWFAETRFARLDAIYRSAGSMAATLDQLGLPALRRDRMEMSAAMPDDRERRHLALAPSTPVITALSVCRDQDGKPIYACQLRLSPERAALVIDNPDSAAD
ncbi:MAG: GntR family transcriptional regulator [Pseudomonadota bacterium]